MSDETETPLAGSSQALQIPGTLTLFGYSPEPVLVTALPRSPSWRAIRVVVFMGGGLLLAPVVGVFPPHAPWILAALGTGGFLAVRKWRERFTLLSVRGRCPKCGREISVKTASPLRRGHSIPCETCHHDSRLDVRFPEDPQSQQPGDNP